MPRALTTSPVATLSTPNQLGGSTLRARSPSITNPAEVYPAMHQSLGRSGKHIWDLPAGPTDTYIPGLVGGLGNAPVMSRWM